VYIIEKIRMKITNDTLHDFIHCHYKAYKKSKGHTGILSDFENYFNQIKQAQKINFEKTIFLKSNHCDNNSTFNKILTTPGTYLNLKFINHNIDITLDGIEFAVDKIIPMFIVPFEKLTNEHKLFIALQATLLQKEFLLSIENCKIIYGKNNQITNFKIAGITKSAKLLLSGISTTLSNPTEPDLILNKHCQVCEFCSYCKEKAVSDSNMTLLDRVTKKITDKYKKKGIFTIQQLSYLYKPKRKKQRNKQLFTHNIELQALSIRTNKIYIQQLPEIKRQSVEIFLILKAIQILKITT